MTRTLFKFLIVFSACAWGNSFAQDADLKERRELGAAVVKANQQGLDPAKLLTAITDPIKPMLETNLKRTNPNQTEAYYTKASEVITRELHAHMEAVISEVFPFMTEGLSNLYADRFTASELKELIKIYENPLVRRGLAIAIEDMPKLIAPHMQAIQHRAQMLVPRINQALVREGLMPSPKP